MIGRIREDPSLALELGMEMMDALGGYYDGDNPFQRFAAHPEGRRMLQERPCLPHCIADREALARLPEGSFGRAYLDFVERAGISADSLIEMANNRSQAPGFDLPSFAPALRADGTSYGVTAVTTTGQTSSIVFTIN